MPRDVFPRAPDRHILDAFLAGNSAPPNSTDATDSQIAWLQGPRLRLLELLDWTWYDTQGALCAMIGASVAGGQTVRGINYLAERLGIPERLERQPSPTITDPTTYIWGDEFMDVGRAFIVAGPMVVAAYRASNTQR